MGIEPTTFGLRTTFAGDLWQSRMVEGVEVCGGRREPVLIASRATDEVVGEALRESGEQPRVGVLCWTEKRMNAEDLIEIDRAARRCTVCRSGRRWRQLNVVRREGRESVVLCAACRAHYHDAPPAQTSEAAAAAHATPPPPTTTTTTTAASGTHRPRQHEDRLKKVLRELPRGEHSTGRIAKAAGLNHPKTLRRLRELEASGEVRQVGNRWSTRRASTDMEAAFERLQATTSNIRVVREDRSGA